LFFFRWTGFRDHRKPNRCFMVKTMKSYRFSLQPTVA
jgi:hypothetical protein